MVKCGEVGKNCSIILVEDDKLIIGNFSPISSLGSQIPIKTQKLISREYVVNGWSTFLYQDLVKAHF